jgi:DNA polymerase (family X)
VIEVNGSPHRLDLDPDQLRLARKRGLSFVMSMDAHSTRAYANLAWAVATARRGWVEKKDVLNRLPPTEFLAALRRT